MLMFTLSISRLTTSNLPWFMDLTFQIPMQYCSLQQTYLHDLSHQQLVFLFCFMFCFYFCCFLFVCFSFCFALSLSLHFFLELFLHFSPVVYWAPTDLESSSSSVISFCLFILFMGFSRQEYWSGLPFPSPLDHTFCQKSPPWPILLGWPHKAWLMLLLN